MSRAEQIARVVADLDRQPAMERLYAEVRDLPVAVYVYCAGCTGRKPVAKVYTAVQGPVVVAVRPTRRYLPDGTVADPSRVRRDTGRRLGANVEVGPLDQIDIRCRVHGELDGAPVQVAYRAGRTRVSLEPASTIS